MLKAINGSKSNIGFALAAILKLVVDWSPTDSLTWDHKVVVALTAGIGLWTGVAIRHAIKKSK